MVGEPDPMAVDREIQSSVRDLLAGHGVAGIVTVRGGQVELYAGGLRTSLDLGNLAAQWPLLPQDIKGRRAAELTRRLVAAHRDAGGTAVTRRGPSAGALAIPIAILLVVVLGAFGYKLFSTTTWGGSRPAPTGVAAETEEQATARHERACEAARKRVFAGATIGSFEMDGWVAELWIAANQGVDMEHHPAVTALVEGGKLAAGADPALAAIRDGTLEIAPGFAAGRAERSPAWRGVTVRFGGGYAAAFVDPAHRARFLALADRVAEASHAEVGALYARCAHLNHHDLGAWFRGSDASAAVAALLYAAGSFTEAPAVDRAALAKIDAGPGPGGELSVLRAAAGKMDHVLLAALVGAQGGAVTRGSTGAVTVTFPVGGGTRAISASRTVARKLGVGGD